jgi:hypothetical protein
MTVQITEEVTLDDIDETIRHINEMLKTDEFGNRMDWRKKEMLQMSIDDLLDARLNLVKTGKLFPDEQS